MTLNASGKLILVQPMAAGGIVLLEEGSERTMVISSRALEKNDKSSTFSWVSFAEKVSTLEESLLVPTVVFGKAALLSRRSADIGDSVVVFSAASNNFNKNTSSFAASDGNSH